MGGWVDGPQGQSEGGTVICPTVDNGVCMHTGSTVSLFMYLARLSRLSFEDGGFNHASQEPFLSTILISMLTFFKVLEMLRRKCHMALSISAIWHSLVNSLFSLSPFSAHYSLPVVRVNDGKLGHGTQAARAHVDCRGISGYQSVYSDLHGRSRHGEIRLRYISHTYKCVYSYIYI